MVGPVGTPVTPAAVTPLSDAEIAAIQSAGQLDSFEPFDLSIAEYHATVSDAVVGQQAQDVIALLALAENRRQIFLAAIAHAQRVAFLVSIAARYRSIQISILNETLKMTLTKINLDSTATILNDLIGPNIASLNLAAASLTVAQQNFNTYLPTYQSAVTTYNAAVSTYDAAVDTYNQALITYNNSGRTGPDDATLQQALSVFNGAKQTFNNAQTSFSTINSLMQNYQDTLNAQISAYNSAVSAYNLLLASPSVSAIVQVYNLLLASWNASVDKINSYLTQLNDMAGDLLLNEIPLLPNATFSLTYTPATTSFYQPYADASAASTAATNNINNNLIPSINAINPNIASANTTFTLFLVNPLLLPPLINPSLVSGNQSYPAIPQFNPFTSVALPVITFQNAYTNVPPLGSIADLGNLLTGIDNQNYTTNNSPLARLGSRTSEEETAGGAGASTQLSVIDPKAQALDPFNESDLSKQAFEAIFNVYGVTLSSPLVDQTNALVATLTETNGLTSTALAQDLLSTSSVNTNNQDTGIRFILSLANLTGLSSLIEDGTLREGLAQILQQDETFNALSADQQAALLDALTQEVGASLLKAALANIAEQFGMPGLVPQLLAAAAGVGDGDALGSLQSQLYNAVVFSQQLQANLNLTPDVANTVASQAVAQAAATPEGITPESLTQAAVPLLSDQGISADTLNGQVNAAAVASSQIVADQVASQEQARSQAYADSLTSALLGKGILDQTQAARINQELVNGAQDQLDQIALNALKEFNLSQEELRALVAEANRAADIHNATLNPVAGLVTTAPVTPSSVQSGFEAIARELLAPAVGDAQALQISSDYGRLIFSSPNSFLARLQANDQALETTAALDRSSRLSDDYFHYTDDIRNPMIATGNPLQLGETLLLTANMAGPASAGVTSVDNQLGVFGNARYNPTGILG